MPRRPPLFRIDPGWPWVAAGLLFIFVAVVVPAQRLLEQDRAELRRLQGVEARIYRLLEAHDRFLADLRAGEESLLLRLAAANLNRMPEGGEALILAESIDRNPIEWIDATVPAADPGPPPRAASLLERALEGQGRLWVTATGVLCLFTGLLLGPGWSDRGREGATREGSRHGAGETAEEADEETAEATRADLDAELARWRPSPAVAAAVIEPMPTPSADAIEDDGPDAATPEPGPSDEAMADLFEEASPPQDAADEFQDDDGGGPSGEIAALASAAVAFEAERGPMAAGGERIRVSPEELAMLLGTPATDDAPRDPRAD
jgi:hypothetical protein